MKICSYCGKEFPETAEICDIDGQPVVDSVTRRETKRNPPNTERQPIPISKELSIFGFSILSGLFGIGVTWLVIGTWANHFFQKADDRFDFIVKKFPLMIIGGIFGFIIGLIVSRKAARTAPEVQERLERKFVGTGGRYDIYSGAPIFVIAVVEVLLFEKLLSKLGNTAGAYAGLGIALLILGIGMYVHDRIPQKLVVPIGIIGWLLTLALILRLTIFRG